MKKLLFTVLAMWALAPSSVFAVDCDSNSSLCVRTTSALSPQVEVGPDGAITTGSSVTASSFFGDGSQLTGISGGGGLVQIVFTSDGEVATTTSLILVDDSIPQNTEGAQFMSLAITPGNTNNILLITIVAVVSNAGGAVKNTCALFQDSTANALVAVSQMMSTNNNLVMLTIKHAITAGTTSATTFKLRCGMASTGTLTFNGEAGNRKFGGVSGSYMEIMEVLP